MNMIRRFVPAVLALTTLLASAGACAVDGARIAMRLINDGELIATPTLLIPFGQQASTETKYGDGTYRIELVAEEKGAGTNIAVRLYVDSGKGRQLIGDTILPLMPGIPATISAANDKATVSLVLEASRAPIPGT